MADFRLTSSSLLLALLLMSALTPTALGTHCSKAVVFVGPEDRSSSPAVTLRCPGIDTTNYAVFYRCVGTTGTPSWINPSLAGDCSTGPRPECLDPMRPNLDTVTVDVTPETEGSYYCVVVDRGATSIACTDNCTGTLAGTSFMITAYPMADPDIDGTQFAVWTGSHVRLQCEFPKGQLSAQYTYTWYKDGNQITGTDPTLLIISAGAMDNGTYQCKVCVTNILSVNAPDFEEMGRSIELNVYTNVTVQPIDSQVVLEGAQVDFTCVATGIPQPSVQWLFAGQRVDNDDFGGIKVMNTDNGNIVTSIVTISRALSQMHNIPVTCVASQTGTIVALPPAQETASLTVMPVFASTMADNIQTGDLSVLNATLIDVLSTVGVILLVAVSFLVLWLCWNRARIDKQPSHNYDYIPYNQSSTKGIYTADVELFVGDTEVEEGEVERSAVRVVCEGVHSDDQQPNQIYADVELLVGRSDERGYIELELEEEGGKRRAARVAGERGRMSGGEVLEEEHVVPECNHGATCGSTEAAQQSCSLELFGSETVHEYDVAVMKYESVPMELYESVPRELYESVPRELYESVPWELYESVCNDYEIIWNVYEKITCDYYEKVGGGYQDGYEVFRADYNAVQRSCEAVLDGHDEL